MAKKAKQQLSGQEKLFQATQWQLMVRKFKKHKLAQAGLWVLVVLYIIVTFLRVFRNAGFSVPLHQEHFAAAHGHSHVARGQIHRPLCVHL